MTTFKDLVDAIRRAGGLKVFTVAFGLICLLAVNMFKSNNLIVDVGATVLFGIFTIVSLLIPHD